MPLKAGIVSQARMTSTRLPGKVLKTIAGKSLLQYHVDRLKWSKLPIVIATTTNQTDDPIVDFAKENSLGYFRGSEMDVLSRYWGAVEKQDWDIIVRVTSDCPLIDGQMIRKAVDEYATLNQDWLYLSNCIQRTFPRGFDFEVFSKKMLQEAFEKASAPAEREHVTPYIHQNKHGKTHFRHITRTPDLHTYRLTVDEPDDFKMIETMIDRYGCGSQTEQEISQVLLKNPDLKKINQHIEQKKV